MCSSKLQKQKSTCSVHANRIPLLERRNSLINNTTTPLVTASSPTTSDSTVHDEDQRTVSCEVKLKPNSFTTTPPASPTGNLKSPTRPPAIKKSKHDKPIVKAPFKQVEQLKHSSSVIVEAPGTIAAARREQVTIMQEQRKLRIAHYGRKKESKSKIIPHDTSISKEIGNSSNANAVQLSEKRCSFITPNSDPIYVAYHDEEWGVPVHDDKLLFELLVLTGAQVGSDWTSVLRKRQDLRIAFSGFDVEIVSKFSEKKMVSISSDYDIELSQVRGVVDNSKMILQMKKEFGSFDNYLWGFVNHKPMQTGYKWCNKIPVKTSKSESISKGMVKRGFRLVGPTVIHSFMQAAGLTNDHLLTCPRHSQLCSQIPNHPSLPFHHHHHLLNTTALPVAPILPSLITATE